MTRAGAVLIASAVLAACQREASPIALRAGDTWIRDVTVVSMEREAPLVGASVIVRDGRIVWVGAAPSARDSVEVIDGTGRFLVPGLIDGHVHLGAPPPGMSEEARASMPGIVDAYAEQLPRSFLYFGFTTVVELGVKDRRALARVRAQAIAPTVLDCGDPIVVANGYPMRMRRPVTERLAEYPNFLYDAQQADSIPKSFRADSQTPQAAVDRVRAGGGRCLKAFYEPGDPSHPFPLPTRAMIGSVRAAGMRAGLPLLIHANSLDAHRFVAGAMPVAVAHGLWSWPGLLAEGAAHAPLPDSLIAQVHEVLDAERAASVGYMPTLRVIDGLVDLDGTRFLDQPPLARVLPASLIAWYRSADGRAAALEDNPGGEVSAILRKAAELGVRALVHVDSTGGRVLFGSDTPSGGGYANPPGLNGYLEMRAMEAAGLTPARVLKAATLENAELFGIQGDVGTIAKGRIADLLLLDRDPLESTAAFDAIRLVILRGRVIPRDSLASDRH